MDEVKQDSKLLSHEKWIQTIGSDARSSLAVVTLEGKCWEENRKIGIEKCTTLNWLQKAFTPNEVALTLLSYINPERQWKPTCHALKSQTGLQQQHKSWSALSRSEQLVCMCICVSSMEVLGFSSGNQINLAWKINRPRALVCLACPIAVFTV